MLTKVVKFGGSSLADAAQFKKVAAIIKADPARRYVVPSAPGKRFKNDTKVTDMLYHCYELIKTGGDIDSYYVQVCDRYNGIIADLGMKFDISGELEYVKNAMKHASGRDYAASRGEYLNGLILAKYLGYHFIDAESVIFFREDGSFDEERTNTVLAEELRRHERAVIPGFYGSMPNGTVKTFSRGGSDITGSIVARAANADLYENWTDVSGFLMGDPRILDNPPAIEAISYRELRELSYMGATVLHEDAIFPVRYAGIPINIRNTNAPEDAGTMIVSDASAYDTPYVITGIAGKKGFVAVNIDKDMMNSEVGFCRKALQAFEENGISIEHMPSGIDTMTVFVHQAEFEGKEQQVISSIRRLAHPDVIDLEADLGLIAVVGRGMRSTRGTAGRIFSALAHANINVRMIDQGSSELNIIIGVSNEDFDNAIRAIYDIFVETQL